MTEWKSKDYYYFPDDVERYPSAWCIIVWSRRGPGKTYSLLRSAYDMKIPLLYMKRTIKDVNTICTDKAGIDLSPYVPINRDAGTLIKPHLIDEGIGGFYDSGEDGNVNGSPISYVCALNALKTIKGMELSFIEWMCLDEFIPLAGEVVKKDEGEQLLSIYMTVLRDRTKRGLDPTKLILFANAENISTPITRELGVIDAMAELQATGESYKYLSDRGILLHHITDQEFPIKESEKTGIYLAMRNTAWGRKAFGGDFSTNDFSNVCKKSIKGYRCIASYYYEEKTHYIYRKGKEYYVSDTVGKTENIYDLTLENEQKKFYYDYTYNLRESCINGNVKFQYYTDYDLIINYRKYFKGF